MHAAFLTPAAVLLISGLLGAGNRRPGAIGLSLAALCGGGAAGLVAIAPGATDSHSAYGAVVLVLLGGVGSGLFVTATALSRHLQSVSPVAAGGGVLVAQILLVLEAQRPPPAGAATAPPTATILLYVITLVWTIGPALLVAQIGRRLSRFIDSRFVRAVLRGMAWALPVPIASGVVLVVLQVVPAAQRHASHDTILAVAQTALLAGVTVLGLGLVATRLRLPLGPLFTWARTAVLCVQLGPFERRLAAAAPAWARPEAIAQPSVLRSADAALYARMVVIWDTTRALLSSVDPRIVEAGLDFAQSAEPFSSQDRRTALAEACWLSQALAAGRGEPPGEQFTVLADPAETFTGDLIDEARFQHLVDRLLRREPRLLEQFDAERRALPAAPDRIASLAEHQPSADGRPSR